MGIIVPDETVKLDERMRADWNVRAATRQSAMRAILNLYDGTEEVFYASGEKHWLDILDALHKVGIEGVHGTGVEIGCGMGRMTIWMAQHFDKLYAQDISDAMLEKAPRLPNVQYVHAPGISIIPGPVDFVLSFLVLQHMDKAIAWHYIDQAQEILAHGGIFCTQLHMTPVPIDRKPQDTILVRGYTPLEIAEGLQQRTGWTPLMALGEAGTSETFRWLILRKW